MIVVLLVAAFAVALGHLVKGLTGFGSAIVSIPILATVVPPADAIVLTTTGDILVGGGLAYAARRDVPWRAVLLLVLTVLPLQVVGTWLHASLPVDTVKRVIGAAVLVASVWLLHRATRAARTGPAPVLGPRAYGEAGLAGAVGGVLSGLVGMPGPPVIAWSMRWLEPAAARALMLAVFVPTSIGLVAGYVAQGLVQPVTVGWSLLVLPASSAGGWAGARLARVLSPTTFSVVVAMVLGVAGLGMVLR